MSNCEIKRRDQHGKRADLEFFVVKHTATIASCTALSSMQRNATAKIEGNISILFFFIARVALMVTSLSCLHRLLRHRNCCENCEQQTTLLGETGLNCIDKTRWGELRIKQLMPI